MACLVSWITPLLKYVLSAIHTDDPFDDKNKDFEDEKRYKMELLFQKQPSQGSGLKQGRQILRDRSSGGCSISGSSSGSKENASSLGGNVFFKSHAQLSSLTQRTLTAPAHVFSTLVITDVLCPILFEMITMSTSVVSLIANMSPLAAFFDYIQCGFYVQGICLGRWMVCHFCSARNRQNERVC